MLKTDRTGSSRRITEPAAMPPSGRAEAGSEIRRKKALLKTGALQNAILTCANFSSSATDERGVIQMFNVGAECMLGCAADGARVFRWRRAS